MAENGFETLLASMDVVDREAFVGVVDKYPDLKNGFLRQSDYSKKMDEIKATSNQFDVALQAIEEQRIALENWQAENVAERNDDGSIVTKAEAAYRDRAAKLEQELQQARTSEMTFDDLSKHIDTLGVIKKNDLETLLAPKEEAINQNFEGFTRAQLKMQNVGFKHLKEFNEPLDTIKLWDEEVIGKKVYDIDRAYENYVSSARADRQKAETERLIAEAEARGEQKAKQNFAMSNSGQMPTDSSGPVLGALQAKLTGSESEQGKYLSPREAAKQYIANGSI